MLQTQFQASEANGSEVEGFWIFLCKSMIQTQTAWGVAILEPKALNWTNLVKDHKAMLHTKFQASEPSSYKEKKSFNTCTFLCISVLQT